MPEFTKEDFLEFLKSEEGKDLFNDDGVKDTISEIIGTKGILAKNRQLNAEIRKIKDKAKKDSLFKEGEYDEYLQYKQDAEDRLAGDDSTDESKLSQKELSKLKRELDKIKNDFLTLTEEKEDLSMKYTNKLKTETVNEILEKHNVAKNHRALLKKAWMTDIKLDDGEAYIMNNSEEMLFSDFADDFFKDTGKVYINKPVNSGGSTVQNTGGVNINSDQNEKQQISELKKAGNYSGVFAVMDKSKEK